MDYRPDLVRLVSNGASEGDIVHFLIKSRNCTVADAYDLIERAGIEFGNLRGARTSSRLLNDSISPERRKYLQELSTSLE
jgi:hypothetical protein